LQGQRLQRQRRLGEYLSAPAAPPRRALAADGSPQAAEQPAQARKRAGAEALPHDPVGAQAHQRRVQAEFHGNLGHRRLWRLDR